METPKVVATFAWLALIWAIRFAMVAWLPALAAVFLFYAHSDEKTYENLAKCTSSAEMAMSRDQLAATRNNDRAATGYLLVQQDDLARQCMIGFGYDVSDSCPANLKDNELSSVLTYRCFSRTWAYTLAAQVS